MRINEVKWPVVFVGCVVIALSAAICGADVLVTRDGQRIETAGPWEVKGRQVLFTTPAGTLSSMRLSAVDLEASRQAGLPPKPVAAPVEPEVERPVVMVLTDKDVRGYDENTFLGYLSLWMSEVFYELNQADLLPEQNPDAQAQLDKMQVQLDQLMVLIYDSCSGYSTLDKPILDEEELELFHRHLDRCGQELEARSEEHPDPEVQKGGQEVAGKLRSVAEEFQSKKEGAGEKTSHLEEIESLQDGSKVYRVRSRRQ